MTSHPDVDKVVETSIEVAKEHNHMYVTLEHLLYGLITHSVFKKRLTDYGIQVDDMIVEVKAYITNLPGITARPNENGEYPSPKKTNMIERVFQRAVTQTLFLGRRQVELIDIWVSMFVEANTHCSFFMKKYGLERESFLKFWYQQAQKEGSKMSNEQAADVLSEYTNNLTELARNNKLDPLIGRVNEIDEIVNVLAKKYKSNVLLVGDAGVGKTAIAEGLATKIVSGECSEFLKEHEVYSLEISSLLAGTKYRGDFEEKVKNVLEALSSRPKSILFIDEAHTMKGAGSSTNGSVDFANMIKPAISRGNLKIIASTTWEEYYESFEKDRALMRRFYRVSVDEPDSETTKKILSGLSSRLEQFHNVKITEEAISSSVSYSIRYMNDRKNPDKSIDLLDAACAKQRVLNNIDAIINEQSIKEQVTRQCNIPQDKLNSDTTDRLLTLSSAIYSKLFGQSEAVEQVLNRVYVSYAGINTETKPMASFLFLGPTGTGKTELAKLLSDNLQMPLLKYDMSEYQEKHSVAALIGAPPGYVGYGEGNLGGGKIINDLSKNPYAILLFDEIEKAHPDVYNLFLQLLDEGRITSTNGKTVSAKNTIVIMTSNLGARDSERNNIGFGDQRKTGEDERALKEFFKPELRNRIDQICKFKALEKTDIVSIVNKFLSVLVKQLSSTHDLDLVIRDDVKNLLAEQGYDSKMGARPLARKIDELLRVPLSKKIIFERLKNSIITCVIKNGEIEFVIAPKHDTIVEELHEDGIIRI